LSIDGPISETDVENGIELQQKVDQWPGLKKDPSEEKYLTYSQEVNFEDLKPNFEDDDEAGNDDREEEESLDENDPDYAAKRKERRERQRAKFIAAKEKREKQRAMEQEAVRQDGEPQQITMKAPTAGWYRVCVQGTWYQVCVRCIIHGTHAHN
jgi:rubrerythrin